MQTVSMTIPLAALKVNTYIQKVKRGLISLVLEHLRATNGTEAEQPSAALADGLQSAVLLGSPLAYFERYQLFWMAAFFSLPVDFLLFTGGALRNGEVGFGGIDLLLGLCIMCGLAGLYKEAVLDGLVQVWLMVESISDENKKKLAPWFFGILLIYSLVDSFFQLSINSWQQFIIIAAVFVVLAPVVINRLDFFLGRYRQGVVTKLALLKIINWKVFIGLVVMLVATRAISILALIKARVNGLDFIEYLTFFLVTFFLLVLLYPDRSLFTASCRRCGKHTWRALKYHGFCPNCSPDRFEA